MHLSASGEVKPRTYQVCARMWRGVRVTRGGARVGSIERKQYPSQAKHDFPERKPKAVFPNKGNNPNEVLEECIVRCNKHGSCTKETTFGKHANPVAQKGA